jgi:hypothetical protein
MTVKAFAKPHIVHYFKQKYGNPVPMNYKTQLGKIIKLGLTTHFVERVQQVPGDMCAFEIKVSNNYRSHFMSQSLCYNVADCMELLFWNEAAIYCLQAILETGSTQKGINQFYMMFGFNDDLYSKDNFRRQLQRNGVLHADNPFKLADRPPRKKAKLTPNLELRIRRMYESGEYTQQYLADTFEVSQKTISNIVNFCLKKD